METKQNIQLRKHGLACALTAALGTAICLPAFASDDVDALKRELAEQRKLIEQLMARQGVLAPPAQTSNHASRAPEAQPSIATTPPPGNVSVYGTGDIAIMNVDSGNGRKTTVNGGGGWTASRIGLKAERNLRGGGLKAVVVAEAGVQFDTGVAGGAAPTNGIGLTPSSSGSPGNGSQLFARQMYAGIEGDFGALTAGRQYTGSYFLLAFLSTARGQGLLGNPVVYMSQVGGMPTRLNNSVKYLSPNVKGFELNITATAGSENNVRNSTAVGATTTNSSAGRGYDAALTYGAGKFKFGVSTWNLNNSSWATLGETGLAKKKGALAGASYDFGTLKLYGNYTSGSIKGGNYEKVTGTLSNADAWSIGILVPYGKHSFMARYSTLNDKSRLNQDAKIYGLGYGYTLDESTQLYWTWGKVRNSHTAGYSLLDAGSLVPQTVTAGFSPSGAMVGANINF